MSKEIEYETKQKTLKVQEGAEAYVTEQRFTYEDYCTWPDDERWELINGIPFKLEAPSRTHQRILIELTVLFKNHLKNALCELYIAPFDVRLNVGEGKDTVVQPDLLVVCDDNKLDERGVKGVPDLIIEISSPSTRKRDQTVKRDLYLQYGAREYWIVDLLHQNVVAHILNTCKTYDVTTYQGQDKVKSTVLTGFELDLEELFKD